MDCNEFQDYITAAVDRYLNRVDMDSFVDHARRCPACRTDYRLEIATKAVVRKRAKMLSTPDALSNSIVERLAREELPVRQRWGERWRELFRVPYLKPALAFVATFAAVILLVRAPLTVRPDLSSASLAGNDIIVQSHANYHAVVDGYFTPKMASVQSQNLHTYFTGNTAFSVLVPAMKECVLVGGVMDEYSGVTLAHVVYRRGNEIVYMYQVCWATVQQGEKLNVSPEVKTQLEQTGWFTDDRPDGEAIVLWTKDGTLCAAVAHMSKEDLLGCLTSDEASRHDPW